MKLSQASTAAMYTYWPETVALTLKPKAYTSTTADTFGASVTCTVCRKLEPDQEEKYNSNLLGSEVKQTFEIWNLQDPAPLPEDTLVEADGTEWVIVKVATLIFGNLFSCECKKAL